MGVLVALGGVVYLALLWCSVLALFAWLSGWRRLARVFGSPNLVAGVPASFRSARFGWVSYSGVLNVWVGSPGLALSPMRFFRPFHSLLFIPWTEMEAELREGALLSSVRLTFPAAGGVRVRMTGRTLDLLRPYLDRVRPIAAKGAR